MKRKRQPEYGICGVRGYCKWAFIPEHEGFKKVAMNSIRRNEAE